MSHADKTWLSERKKRVKCLIEGIYGEVKDNKILDVGMGQWSLVKDIFPEFYVIGIDYVYPSFPPDVFYYVDIRKALPFKDGEFALVFAGEVIEHLGFLSARRLLSEIFRVLSDKGYLLLTTPNGYRNILKKILRRPTICAHLDEFSFRQVRKLLVETGFEIIRSEGIQPLFVPWRWFDKFALLKLFGLISSQLIFFATKRTKSNQNEHVNPRMKGELNTYKRVYY